MKPSPGWASVASPATLKIHEIFYSIQGESLLAGKPTVFIRTATCNLRCSYCDTRQAFWNGSVMDLPAILDRVGAFHARYVCVTGGEPLGQKAVIALLEALLDHGYRVSLETNGSFSVQGVPPDVVKVIDIKCPGSHESKSMLWENVDLLLPHDELKFVLSSRSDFEWAEKVRREHALSDKCAVLYSPVFGKVEPRDLAAWILASGAEITMQLQLHKIIWGPCARGV